MSSVSPSTVTAQLQWRYATKAFAADLKIPTETWTALEDALVLTPSSFGLQPWKFLVITNPELREQLVPQAWGQRQIADASHLVVMCVRTKIDVAFVDSYLQDMATTRGIPVSALDQLRGMMIGFLEGMTDEQLDEWAAKQCYIALGNFMTSAALLEVDTCPMEGFVPAQFDEILGLKDQGLRSVVCCPAGYRSPDDKFASMAKVRWAKDQVIEHR
jgi:nitroreductase